MCYLIIYTYLTSSNTKMLTTRESPRSQQHIYLVLHIIDDKASARMRCNDKNTLSVFTIPAQIPLFY